MAIDAPIHTNQNNLPRVLKAGLPALVVFWERDCPPCDQLMPALDRLARTYAGRALVVKVNAAEEPALLQRYHIDALPGLVFVKDGREVATGRGAAGEKELASWLDYLLGRGAQPPTPSGPAMPVKGARPSATTPPPYQGAGATVRPGASAGPAPNGGSGQPVTLTDANFDQVIGSSKVPVLVDFWAVWCGPCRMVSPVVEQLARDYAGRAVVGKVNVDENPNVAGRYGIMSIPTLLIFKNGQVVDQIIGAQPPQILRQRLANQVR